MFKKFPSYFSIVATIIFILIGLYIAMASQDILAGAVVVITGGLVLGGLIKFYLESVFPEPEKSEEPGTPLDADDTGGLGALPYEGESFDGADSFDAQAEKTWQAGFDEPMPQDDADSLDFDEGASLNNEGDIFEQMRSFSTQDNNDGLDGNEFNDKEE
jgi:hypothetical protein